MWRKFVESMEPPVKGKYKTTARFVPECARRVEESRRDFVAAHQWVLDRLDALDAMDLGADQGGVAVREVDAVSAGAGVLHSYPRTAGVMCGRREV